MRERERKERRLKEDGKETQFMKIKSLKEGIITNLP